MAARTYLPALKKILETGCKYIAKYRNQILGVIGEDHAAQLDAVVAACNALMAILNLYIPSGT